MNDIPIKNNLADLGCTYTLTADSLSLVGEDGITQYLCMKVGRAAVMFKLSAPNIASLRLALSKL